MNKEELTKKFSEVLENLSCATAYGFNQEDIDAAWEVFNDALGFDGVVRNFNTDGNHWWEENFAFDEDNIRDMIEKDEKIVVGFFGTIGWSISVSPVLNETAEETVRRAFEYAKNNTWEIVGAKPDSFEEDDLYSGNIWGT